MHAPYLSESPGSGKGFDAPAGVLPAEAGVLWKSRCARRVIMHYFPLLSFPFAPYGWLMSKATKLLHTRYRVNDLERTVQFYRNVLGLEEVGRHRSPRGSELVFLKAPESEELIEITCFPGSGPVQVQSDLTHLAFEVDSIESFGRHLETLGLKYSDEPTTSSTGTVFAFIDAPEGYEIELIQKAETGS
jgi:lactoylglutathione lyase